MPWFPVRVSGDSMLPTLRSGDLLLVRSLRTGEPREGQIVCAETDTVEAIKRVTRPPADGTVWLEGDNAAASTDSRSLGAILVERLTGVVVLRYWPLHRARRL